MACRRRIKSGGDRRIWSRSEEGRCERGNHTGSGETKLGKQARQLLPGAAGGRTQNSLTENILRQKNAKMS